MLGGQTSPRAEGQSLVVLASSVFPTLPGLSLLYLCLSISPFTLSQRFGVWGLGFGGDGGRAERFLGCNKKTTASSVGPAKVPLRAFWVLKLHRDLYGSN